MLRFTLFISLTSFYLQINCKALRSNDITPGHLAAEKQHLRVLAFNVSSALHILKLYIHLFIQNLMRPNFR